jgi:hypothetical protein
LLGVKGTLVVSKEFLNMIAAQEQAISGHEYC